MAVFKSAYMDEYPFGARGWGDETVGFLFVPVRYLSLDTHGFGGVKRPATKQVPEPVRSTRPWISHCRDSHRTA